MRLHADRRPVVLGVKVRGIILLDLLSHANVSSTDQLSEELFEACSDDHCEVSHNTALKGKPEKVARRWHLLGLLRRFGSLDRRR